MSASMTDRAIVSVKENFGGTALAAVIAGAATFLAEHYAAPVMLFALLIGMAFNFLATESKCAPGIAFSSKSLLRLAVALLGFRLSLGDIQLLGVWPIVAVFLLVILTLGAGVALSRMVGRKSAFGFLAGGSVAICGASAALAIASVLPQKEGRDRDVLFVVIAVTALSTVAMICYPILFKCLDFSDLETGFLIGATIHDVAQVVGAGYSVSEEAGVVATFVKMVRVALLPIVMLIVMIGFRHSGTARLGLPWFLVCFVAAAILVNLGVIPDAVVAVIKSLSAWLLAIAISAIGIKTNLGEIAKVDGKFVFIVVAETVFLLVLALAAARFLFP
ncbi:YeiH family protein [Limibacillus halophilus]|uniref:Putative integral membrane protein (TIGR00698 family) n=1 Tax=Limibacillus halophilus TaxID=1579333 RepID=A0A839SWB9_9PROT|nr:putative sulfate exporter family transporter [Limibacillus halophilus]MBB3065990.1 putative integral membrane protein (TIGR00698 family) [Limibacillus halophilus]